MGDRTKGPWSVNGRTPSGWRVDPLMSDRVGLDFLAHPVAIVPDGHDARLIAAAPDLYEALRELDPANGHRTDCNERKCGECSTCRARAALAKAEGRS